VMKGHPDKIHALTKLLDKHEIKYGFTNSGSVSGYNYLKNGNGNMDAAGALVVSTNQPKGKMVKVLFEPDAKLSNPLTYDITAWSVPHAYGLETIASTSLIAANAANPYPKIINQIVRANAGYVVSWNSLYDAAFLSELLQNDIRVRFSEKDLRFGGKDFKKGSLIITKSDNRTNEKFDETVTKIANKHERALYVANSSFSDSMTDFGSPDVKLINTQRVALLRGNGTSSLSYGSLWHFFEQQLKYPVTSIDTDDFNAQTLSQFDVLIMPSGWYGRFLNENTLDGLTAWVRRGGKIIALGNAVSSFAGKDGFGIKAKGSDASEEKDKKEDNLTPYDQRESEGVKDLITGSIYETTLDASHPMAFGFGDTYYSLKIGNDAYDFLESGYNVGYIKGDPRTVSGFSGADAKAGLANSVTFAENRIGSGSVIYLVDDVLFRSFWENGKLFLVNSIFFVNNNKFTL